MAVLKVVSIGGFGHSPSVFNELQTMDQVDMAGVAPAYVDEDISFFAGHAFCQNAPRFDDYRAMIQEVTPDVAIISSRLDRIAPIAIDAAQAGCHLICEKPLALNHAMLERVYHAVKANNIKLTAMLSMRSEGPFQAARQVYQSGAIGQAVLANGRKSYKWGTRPDWFADKALYGGTISWVGIHALDFINYITDLEFTQVAAMGGTIVHPDYPGCEDHCGVTLELNNHAHATVSVDLLRPESAPTHGDDWVRIVGTQGVLEASVANNTCVIINRDGTSQAPIPPQRPLYREFILSLTGSGDAGIAHHVPFMLTDTCLTAQQSLRTAAIMSLTPDRWRQ